MGRRRPQPAGRVQLGEYWLEYRAERDGWFICHYNAAARTRRRRSLGISGGDPADPPEAARAALAEQYLATHRPSEPQQPKDAAVAELIAIWQRDHVGKETADPARYAISVKHLLRFFAHERERGAVPQGGVMVADVNRKLVDRFIAFRQAEGVGGWTINRDLKALRGALNHAWRNELITSAPFVRDVDARERAKPRSLVYRPEQLAAFLEAAYRDPRRHHVFLYTMIALSTCGRSEAILDLDSRQLRDGLIYFLADDRQQTKKRRSVVPIAPTLAPWLEGITGKVITYRTPIAERHWADPAVREYFEKPCYDVGNSFEACLIEAGISEPVLDDAGDQVLLPPRAKLGETAPRPLFKGLGTPNTLRHTIITEMHRRGVPEGQIDAAAGHAGDGTGKRHYRHLRPDYLADLVDGIEDFWREMTRFTTVHLSPLRSHIGPRVASLAVARAKRRQENG